MAVHESIPFLFQHIRSKARQRRNYRANRVKCWHMVSFRNRRVVTNRTTQKIRTAPLIHQGIPLLSVPIPSFPSIDTIILRSVIESRDTHRLRPRRIKLRNTLDRIK